MATPQAWSRRRFTPDASEGFNGGGDGFIAE